MRRSYIYKNFVRASRDFVLSLQTLELVQTKSNMSSDSLTCWGIEPE